MSDIMSDRQITDTTKYVDSLVKLIPSEFVATYLAIHTATSSIEDEGRQFSVLVFSAIFLLIVLPVYFYKTLKVINVPQIAASWFSLLIWIISLGGILEVYSWYLPIYSTIAIILWTLISPSLVSHSK